MPAGPAPMGFAYFVATKFVGYTAFCHWGIRPQLSTGDSVSSGPLPIPSPLKAGAARTLIGVAIGATVGIGFWSIPYFNKHDSIANAIFFSTLVPVRVFEWWLLLAWMYKGFSWDRKSLTLLIGVGILVSFALDVVGIVTAFVLPGGMWVC